MTHSEAIKFLMNRVRAGDFHGETRSCPYPNTEKVFGTNQVHVLVCKTCKYAVHHKWHGGISCGYEGESNGTS